MGLRFTKILIGLLRPITTYFMIQRMRNLGLSVLSLALTASVIGNAYYQKKQFYPSVVYITKSNPSMAVSNSIGCVVVKKLLNLVLVLISFNFYFMR